MQFKPPLLQGRFVRRYKRFFADVEVDTGSGAEIVTAHCPNTGSMKHCLVENSECWISPSDNPKRKLAYTLEAVTAEFGGMAGVNTGRANKLVMEALRSGVVAELSGYMELKPEVKFGQQNSRLDFLLSDHSVDDSNCYLEVKNLTLGLKDGSGSFPDAITERGRKHLTELAYAKAQGHRAVLLFCVQHTAIDSVRPAWDFDPAYCETLSEVILQGVEVLAYGVKMTREEFVIDRSLPFCADR